MDFMNSNTEPGHPWEDEGHGLGILGSNVDKLNVDAVDRCDELWPRVEVRFGPAPVGAASPIPDEILDLLQWNALGVIRDGFLIRPARKANPPSQIVELRLLRMKLKLTDAVVCAPCGSGSRRDEIRCAGRLQKAGRRDDDGAEGKRD